MRILKIKIVTLAALVIVLYLSSACSVDKQIKIIYPEKSAHQVYLAAKEVRRYIYLRTGELLDLSTASEISHGNFILVSDDSNPLVRQISNHKAPTGGFFIKSEKDSKRAALVISGDDPASTLYAAYRFAEKLGCRFYLHGDVIPDKKISLDISGFDEQGQPVTINGRQWDTRGIQPFQNFPAGAVMWGKDDWKMYISQLPKMGMNFIGLHTYMADPEDDHVGDYGPNLNVWLGHEDDLNPDGTVDYAFNATFFHTHQDIIGWGKTNTSDLYGGTNQLFPTDGYPNEFIGETYHTDQSGYINSFNNAAKLFSEVFTYAKELGVKTATGIEIPLGRDAETGGEEMVNGIPSEVQSRLKDVYGLDPISNEASEELYKGMYKWLLYNNIPVDYFWIWTTEIWMPWGGASEDPVRVEAARQSLRNAVNVYDNMPEKPFDQFALGGWVFGAQGDPDVFGDILEDPEAAYSFMNPPYDEEGEHMETEEWIDMVPDERVKWPFTWMEYDYALEQPSFHMYRVLEDGLLAYEQNADGFMGEFWRTKMIAHMFAAFKNLTWDYASTGEEITIDIPLNHTERNARIEQIHLDWANHEFGKGIAAEEIASILADFDKRNDVRFKNVTDFIEGADDIYSQGYITGGDWGSDHKWGPWPEEKDWFAWVDRMDELRNTIEGKGNLARFDYWHNVFKVHKYMAHFSSELNQYEAKTNDGDLTGAAIHRSKLARLWEQIMTLQVQRVYDEVDLGVILNLHWRTWRNWVEGKYDANFVKAGGTLPVDKDPSMEYTGDKFITCIPLLTQVKTGEPLSVKALIMGEVKDPLLHYRPLGAESFFEVLLENENRGVFRGVIPGQSEDFEWYVSAKTSLGDVLFPATAGADDSEKIYQTVIVSE
jgi:hypothetical protein